MKWMKKLRLINWHYFKDETLEFGNQTLVTGRNAAGKSTIVDALQVLFVADGRKVRFNSAAHDEAKRSLINYLKGKKGTDQAAFVRNGDFTSYIVAEFRDVKKKESFVVGVVFDVPRDGQPDDEYFIISDAKLDDLTFLKTSQHLRNREEFKRYAQETFQKTRFERNKGVFQKAFLNRLGQLHDRFFSIFTKALSFKPIQNVRDFVYDYILDQKELQLGLLRENFELHERYKTELVALQERKGALMSIKEKFHEYSKIRETVLQQEYAIRGLRYTERQEILDERERDKDSLKKNIDVLKAEQNLVKSQKEKAEENRDNARDKLQSNQVKLRQEALQEKKKELLRTLEDDKRKFYTWQDQILKQKRLLEDLLEYTESNEQLLESVEKEKVKRSIGWLAELLDEVDSPGWGELETEKCEEHLKETGEFLAHLYERISQDVFYMQDEIKKFSERAKFLRGEIQGLENKKRPYPNDLVKLKKLLEEKLDGRSSVWVFCEEIEVLDEEWRNALEGYLNTQRFDLLVEPQHFREALSLYERNKRTYQLEGVGLVDTEKEFKYLGKQQSGSLAGLLQTSNKTVQARIDHLLGTVICALDERDMLQYRTSVTKTCMTYKNLVARQIKKEVYRTPYIGSQAIIKLLEMKRKELLEVEGQIEELQKKMNPLNDWKNRLTEKRSEYQNLASLLGLPMDIATKEDMYSGVLKELQSLDLSEVESLKETHQYWKDEYRELDEREKNIIKEVTTKEQELKTLTGELFSIQIQLKELEAIWNSWKSEHSPEMWKKAEERWKEALAQDIPTARKVQNWTNNQTGNKTQQEKKLIDLMDARFRYNSNYTYNSDPSALDNDAYQTLLDQIETVDLPQYQEKLETALRESEEEFQSHFVYKMREAIEMARREFYELNYALKDFPFHEDRYHFKVVANERYKRFYDVIMDPQVVERGSLFDFAEEDKQETLRELFEKLVHGEAGEMDEFTDYRQYLDFDIVVTSHKESFSFSNVLREKSGGETQTPFYIAILASFHHLYKSNKTARLVVFDEAFNKMDEERIQQALRLIKEMNLQLIAAVPDEKMPHMAPEVQTTLVVIRDGYRCFVEMLDKMEQVIGDEGEQVEQRALSI